MAAEHDVGMSGGDGRIKDRAQEGTSVGHRFTVSAEGNLGCRLSIQSLQKKTPAGRPRGRLGPQMGRLGFAMVGSAFERAGVPVRSKKTRQALAAGVTGENFAEAFPRLALELDQLHLRDGSKVGC